jgi:hypothetical protein
VRTRRALLLAAVLLSVLPLQADSALPPAKWWRRPQLVERLAITEDQQDKLDSIFRNHASDLIDLRAEIEKRTVELRGNLDQRQLNRQDIQRIAGRLNEARGKLFDRELMMLVDMRSVLTDSQWSRMRNMLDGIAPPSRKNLQRPPR